MVGLLVVISGPSGAGKGTIIKHLTPQKGYAFSVSATTRKPRTGEVDGKDYFFKTHEEFKKLLDDDNLLEHAEYVKNFYGTPRKYVEEQITKGKTVLLDIEVIGALQVKQKFPDAVLVFLMPPTIKELELRLTGRNTEEISVVELRLQKAMQELKLIHHYDYLVINDNISDTVEKINAIVMSEKLKPHRCQETVKNFVK